MDTGSVQEHLPQQTMQIVRLPGEVSLGGQQFRGVGEVDDGTFRLIFPESC
jgi:hypothetical protein